jgi:DNA-binding LacI/PurR family transcriptional regulator
MTAHTSPKRADMVTISDVARHAGVGLATVSRVLNGSDAVRPETRARVLAAMDELGYLPSAAARALSRGRTNAIGVVMPLVDHPASAERLRGALRHLASTAYDLVVFNTAAAARPDGPIPGVFSRQRTDGLLVVDYELDAVDRRRLVQANLPAVLVGVASADLPCVVTDDVAGGRLATEHLLALGHRRIGFIGDEPGPADGQSEGRRAGFRAALTAAGSAAADGHVGLGPHERAVARAQGRAMLAAADRPSAVVAASDHQALGVLAAAADLGLRVPEEVSVVGFGDIELAAYAGLTTVSAALERSGELGAERLLQGLNGVTGPPDRLELPPELIARATTGPAPPA